MSKVICEICGTTYQDTAECCPICGCPRDMSGNVSDDDFVMDQMPALNKGGRYSSGKRKRKFSILTSRATISRSRRMSHIPLTRRMTKTIMTSSPGA